MKELIGPIEQYREAKDAEAAALTALLAAPGSAAPTEDDWARYDDRVEYKRLAACHLIDRVYAAASEHLRRKQAAEEDEKVQKFLCAVKARPRALMSIAEQTLTHYDQMDEL